MSWKWLFLTGNGFWLCLLVLAQCVGPGLESSGPASSEYRGIVCPGEAGGRDSCQDIQAQFARYQTLLDSLQKQFLALPHRQDSLTTATLEHELAQLKGYQFSIEEVSWILKRAHQAKQEHIYLMFAVNSDSNSVRYRQKALKTPILYLDAYLEVVTPSGGRLISHSAKALDVSQNDYADFPKPCPTHCPDP